MHIVSRHSRPPRPEGEFLSMSYRIEKMAGNKVVDVLARGLTQVEARTFTANHRHQCQPGEKMVAVWEV